MNKAQDDMATWSSALATSIEAWRDGEFDAGRAACEIILTGRNVPDDIRAQAQRNLSWYARSLAELAPDVHFRRLPRLASTGWSWFNPSVAVDQHGVHVFVRSSNYSIQRDRQYAVNDREGIFRTRYYHLELDHDLELRSLSPIYDLTGRASDNKFPVTGFEDCRLINHHGDWYALATERSLNGDGICQQVRLRLKDNTWVECQPLSTPLDGHQKNWMPFVRNGSLLAVTHCAPTRIVDIGHAFSSTLVSERDAVSPLAVSFRGSSQGVPVDGGTLFVIHESVDRSPTDRIYVHRAILLDAHQRLTHVSPQFFFTRRGIEFCAGLAQLGDNLLMTFGVNDSDAYLTKVPRAQMLAMLKPIDSYSDCTHIPASPPIQAPKATTGDIVSVTLAGHGTAEMIGDALRSVVEHVDRCVVIDTGTGIEGITVAQSVAGEKLQVRTLDWPGDFAAARNVALDIAASMGAAWAVMLDTDERFDPGNLDLRTELDQSSFDVLSVGHADGTYAKPRVFRLPAPGTWIGQTHEYFDQRNGRHGTLHRASFSELPKSPERLRTKLERDLTILRKLVVQSPEDPRWWYYLGDTLSNLGDKPAAIEAFDRCASLDGWNEEAAWARYREAECWLALGNPTNAIRSCANGLSHHAGVAELAWLAGYASWVAKRYDQAVRWSQLALVHGDTEAIKMRIGFRNPMALHEGPWDVLRFAHRALGNVDAADEAEQRFQEARRRRLGRSNM